MPKFKKKAVVITKGEIDDEVDQEVEITYQDEDGNDITEPNEVELERGLDVLEFEENLKKMNIENDEDANKIANEKDPLRIQNTEGKTVKKTKQKLSDEIKCLEEKLGLQHKPISRWSRMDLEKYLVELIAQCGNKIQEKMMEDKIGNTETVTTKVKLDKDGKKKMVETLKTEIDAVRNKKSGIDPKEKKMTLSEQGGVDFLYKVNFLLYYALENGSKITEERTNINLEGLTDQLLEDKENILIPIYKQLYNENKEIIEKYGTALMQLCFYTISTCAVCATTNLKKKHSMRLQMQN